MKKIYTLILSAFIGASAFAQTPPDFTVTDTDGNTLSLYSELAGGKTILLDFFFTTCPPCIANAGNIEHIYQEFGAGTPEFDIWGINDRNSNAQIEAYKAQYDVTNPCVSGTEGGGDAVVNSYASTYNFTGFPTYAVVCSDQSVTWDIWPISTNAPEIQSSLETDCGLQTNPAGIEDVIKVEFNAIYPNPASEYATVSYKLIERAKVSLEVYNMLGSLIKTVTPGPIYAGQKQTNLNVRDLDNGHYFVKLMVNDEEADVMKLSVLR
jgi:peroxiredoxin